MFDFKMKFRAIKENHLFSKAYAKGKRAVTSALAVYCLPDYRADRLAKEDTRGRKTNRYGFTVSTKIGGAVVRTRCRRIMREGLRALEKSFTVKVGFLVVIVARAKLQNLTSTDAEHHLTEAFRGLGLI